MRAPAGRPGPNPRIVGPPAGSTDCAATGYQGFDDFCTFGIGTGIIGIAEASGLGPLLDIQP